MRNKIAIQASNNIEKNIEIIKILENLGGKNNFLIGLTNESSCYYIREDNLIECSSINYCYNHLKGYRVYTLEEYKKEFMENKEIKIIPPESYEIDKENSTFEKIVFKKVEEKLTYEKIREELFKDKKSYFLWGGNPTIFNPIIGYIPSTADHAPTQHQLERLLAINKLMNVAYYLNDGWEPDWNNTNILKYCLYYDHNLKKIMIDSNLNHQKIIVYFKTRELVQQAIEILGEEVIKTALGV